LVFRNNKTPEKSKNENICIVFWNSVVKLVQSPTANWAGL
jgi:hypothetical protein